MATNRELKKTLFFYLLKIIHTKSDSRLNRATMVAFWAVECIQDLWYDELMIENLKDKVLEGKWKYHHYQDNCYVFENIYNGNMIALRLRQVQNILDGKDTIARIQCRKIWKEGKSRTQWQDNSVIKSYTHQMRKYKKSRSGI